MPTKRRFHLPNREWSKIIRFNGVDYLLSSLFDRDFDFNKEYTDSLEFDFDSAYNKEVARKKRLEMQRRKSKRVVEDFFDNLDDIDDVVDDIDATDEYQFVLTTKDGGTRYVNSSKDVIKNKIFALFVQLLVVDDQKETMTNVDDFVKKSGENAYMIKFINILYEDGCIRFEVINSTNLSSYIKIFATDDMQTKFMIKCYNRNVSRLRNHDLVNLDNEQFKDIIKYDVAYDEKDMVEFYSTLLEKIKKYFGQSGTLTLCRRTQDIDVLSQSADVDFLKDNFKIVSKLSKLKSDPQFDAKMKKVLMMNKDFISKMYKDGENQPMSGVGDEFYVMIGGPDKFVKDFIDSSFFKYEVFRGCWCIVTKVDKDPNVITKELVSKVCLVPFSKFIYALPALYMYIL